MNKMIFLAGAALALAFSGAFPGGGARAQSSYPTASSRITVPATVPLQCNASAQNCLPPSTTNPVPVAIVSGGGGGGGGSGGTATSAAPTYANNATGQALSLDLSGNLRTLASQNGGWTVGLTGTLPAFAATPTFNIGTAPSLTIGALPSLPAGANAIGTVALPTAQASTTSGQTGALVMGGVTTTAPAYTTAQANPLSLTTGGGLRSDVASYNGTALTGTVTAYGTAPTGNVFGVNAAVTSGTITTVGTVTTVGSMTSGNLAIPGIIADQSSAALTTTTTTATLTPTFGPSYEVNIPVTAVTGTTPTLDVVVQESDDTGTNWFDIFHFPRITAIGMYRSPKLPLTGNRVRYVQTVGGTTPSFTRAINRLQSSDTAAPLRRIFDRTLATTQALSSTTATMNVLAPTRSLQLVISAGTITTTAPALQLQGTEDNGVSWYAIGTPLVAVSGATVQLTVSDFNAERVRAIVTTAGAGATLNYVAIKAF